MNKQDLETLLLVLDAAIMKGGIIAPDAMLAVSTARARAKSLMELMSPSETLKTQAMAEIENEQLQKEWAKEVYDVNILPQTDKPSESKK